MFVNRLCFLFVLGIFSVSSFCQDLKSEFQPRAQVVLRYLGGRGPALQQCETSEKGRLRCQTEEEISDMSCSYFSDAGEKKYCACKVRTKQFVCSSESTALGTQWEVSLSAKKFRYSVSRWSIESYTKNQIAKAYEYEMAASKSTVQTNPKSEVLLSSGASYDFVASESWLNSDFRFYYKQKNDLKWVVGYGLSNNLQNLTQKNTRLSLGPLFEITKNESPWGHGLLLAYVKSTQSNESFSGWNFSYRLGYRRWAYLGYELYYWNVDQFRTAQNLFLEFKQRFFSDRLQILQNFNFEKNVFSTQETRFDQVSIGARLGVLWQF